MSVPADQLKIEPEKKPATTTPVRDFLNYEAPETKPVTTEVDAPTETVEGRITNLTSGGNPYVERARKDAQREANTRGLINSTMAGQAGVDAAIRNALPIASQDAQTYTQTRLTNQADQNRFLENQQSANLNRELASHQSGLQMQRDEANAAFNESLATLESNLRSNEMRLDAELRKDIELTMNDAKMADEVKLQYINTINNIMRDAQEQIVQVGLSDRSAAAQAAAIKRIEQNRNASIKVYQDLLEGFDDWDWGTDFTPGGAAVGAPGGSVLDDEIPPPPSNSMGGAGWFRGLMDINRWSGERVWGDWEWNPGLRRWVRTGGQNNQEPPR